MKKLLTICIIGLFLLTMLTSFSTMGLRFRSNQQNTGDIFIDWWPMCRHDLTQCRIRIQFQFN